MISRDKARKISSDTMGGLNLKNDGHIINKTLKYIDSQITLTSRLGRFYCKINCEIFNEFYDYNHFTNALIEKLYNKGFKVDLIGSVLTISW